MRVCPLYYLCVCIHCTVCMCMYTVLYVHVCVYTVSMCALYVCTVLCMCNVCVCVYVCVHYTLRASRFVDANADAPVARHCLAFQFLPPHSQVLTMHIEGGERESEHFCSSF